MRLVPASVCTWSVSLQGWGTGRWTLSPGAAHHPAGPRPTSAQFEPGWLQEAGAHPLSCPAVWPWRQMSCRGTLPVSTSTPARLLASPNLQAAQFSRQGLWE